MGLQNILIERQGAVAIVLLHRPNNRNAGNVQMADELVETFDALDKDDSVRVVVLSAKPSAHKTFCAGADLAGGTLEKPGRPEDHRDWGGRIALSILRCSKPVIAVVTGHAVGIGVNMTLPCDIRVGWKDAKVALPFAKLGILPEGTSSFFLPKLLGLSKALSIFMTAKMFQAKDSPFNELFLYLEDTPEATYERGLALATELAENNSPVSMAGIKRMCWATSVGEASPVDAHLLESRLLFELENFGESKEGIAAFLQKRKPQFKKSAREATSVLPGWKTENGFFVKTKL